MSSAEPAPAPLAALLAMWPEPVWVLDAEGRIVWIGEAVERQLGWRSGDLEGRHLGVDLVDPEDHDRLTPRLLDPGTALGTGLESRTGIRIRRRDGTSVGGELIVGDLPDTPGASTIAVLRPDRDAYDRDLFTLIFQNAPDIISIVDRGRGQLMVNQAAERLLGHNLRRLEDNIRMVHPEDRVRVQTELPPQEGGFGGPVRYRARTAAGDWLWLESTSSDLGATPPVGGILVFTRDVTAEVVAGTALAASRARMLALVRGLRAGVLVQDEDGRVVIANDLLFAMFGLRGDPGAVEGVHAAGVLSSLADRLTEPGRFVATTADIVASGEPQVTRWSLPAGGTVEAEATPIRGVDAANLGYLWAFRDISDRVEAEEHRRRMIVLEREAREAAEQQNVRLHELDRMRAQMIATVSHEFRTPLTPIASHVELLLDGHGDPLSDSQRESLEAIDRNVARLRRLVDDLLTVRRVEQGLLDIQPAPVNVASLVATQAAQFAAYASRIEVELSCHVVPGRPAMADADRLGTVIDNLIANALKFTPGGGRVEVTAVSEHGDWVIRVADTGRGIAPDDIPHVFESFFRSAAAVHEGLPGSGLGLAVSRALVEGHGGRITAESTPGAGSVFTVRIPIGGPAR